MSRRTLFVRPLALRLCAWKDPEKRKVWAAANKGKRSIYDKTRYATNPDLRKKRLEQASEHRKRQLAADPVRWRARRREIRLKSLYAMSASDFENMFMNQGGSCACCRRACTRETIKVDHCHSTNAVRGLLCSACNVSIGNLGDTAEGVFKAFAYLCKSKKAA